MHIAGLRDGQKTTMPYDKSQTPYITQQRTIDINVKNAHNRSQAGPELHCPYIVFVAVLALRIKYANTKGKLAINNTHFTLKTNTTKTTTLEIVQND